MAVLIEGISVVVRTDTIGVKFEGGYDAFEEKIPNKTYCTDGELVRVGFLSPDDASAYVRVLKSEGLGFTNKGRVVDIAVLNQNRGLTVPCDWLEFNRLTIREEGVGVSACWLFDEPRDAGRGIYIKGNSMRLATPEGWKFEGSLTEKFGPAPVETGAATLFCSMGN